MPVSILDIPAKVFDEQAGAIRTTAQIAVDNVAIDNSGVEQRLDQTNALLTSIDGKPAPTATDVSGVEARLDTLIGKPDFQPTNTAAVEAKLDTANSTLTGINTTLGKLAPNYNWTGSHNLSIPSGQTGTAGALAAGAYLLTIVGNTDGLPVQVGFTYLEGGDRLHFQHPGGDLVLDNGSTVEVKVSLVPFTI